MDYSVSCALIPRWYPKQSVSRALFKILLVTHMFKSCCKCSTVLLKETHDSAKAYWLWSDHASVWFTGGCQQMSEHFLVKTDAPFNSYRHFPDNPSATLLHLSHIPPTRSRPGNFWMWFLAWSSRCLMGWNNCVITEICPLKMPRKGLALLFSINEVSLLGSDVEKQKHCMYDSSSPDVNYSLQPCPPGREWWKEKMI